MRIAIDKDEVVADFFGQFLPFLRSRYGVILQREEITEFDLSKILRWPQERVQQAIEEFHESSVYERIKPIQGAQEAIHYLNAEHELVLITSAMDVARSKIEQWVENYFPEFKGVHFASNYLTKGNGLPNKAELCDRLKVDLIVDDHYGFLVPCTQQGKRAMLMDREWNEQYKKQDEQHKIIRVYSWQDAVEKIDALTQSFQSQ